MKTIAWRVRATSAPAAVRPCGACGAEAKYESTGLFRVNAQKRRLDVWLIYRCSTCGRVWNCAVVSRGRPESVGWEKLERFQANDADLALECVLDVALLKRNGAQRGAVEYAVEGEAPCEGEDRRIEIESEGLSGIRLAEVLRAKLGLSRSDLRRCVEAGLVEAEGGGDVLSAKLRPRQTIIVRAARG